MEQNEIKIMVDGKELSLGELNALIEQAKGLQKTVAAAKKDAKAKGIKISEDKAPKEKTAEYNLLVATFKPVIESEAENILAMFVNSRTDKEDVTTGQDSISFSVTDEYQVIIRSNSVTKAKKAKRDADAKAKVIEVPAEVKPE